MKRNDIFSLPSPKKKNIYIDLTASNDEEQNLSNNIKNSEQNTVEPDHELATLSLIEKDNTDTLSINSNDTDNLRLYFSPVPEDDDLDEYQSNNDSQPNFKVTNITGSYGMGFNSPDKITTVTSNIISKFSNGNSSTPTELTVSEKEIHMSNDTPDNISINKNTGKSDTTPSTISPLKIGHSLLTNTPNLPVFDVHVCNNENGEFMSLYIVRADTDLGKEISKEYQKITKRFTVDPYMADISVNNSPSSVTSGGMIQLRKRTSLASTVSSTSSSSNHTIEGNFVVPQPPKRVSQASTSIKGYEALMKQLQEIFSQLHENTIDETQSFLANTHKTPHNETTVIKNGKASPKEVTRCDRVTPKSSVRGQRHLGDKRKRIVLPKQTSSTITNLNKSIDGKPRSRNYNLRHSKPKYTVSAMAIQQPIVLLEKLPSTVTEIRSGIVILAKWTDGNYYSAKIIQMVKPNMYLVFFYNDKIRTISDRFIIFGDKNMLPLRGHSVHVFVDTKEEYEPALVIDVIEDNNDVTYTCVMDGNRFISVTAAKLCLSPKQVMSLKGTMPPSAACVNTLGLQKCAIQLDPIVQIPRQNTNHSQVNSQNLTRSLCSPRSPIASTSGVKDVCTPYNRPRFDSESSESTSWSPELIIEEVAGVEPETQHTPKKTDGVKARPQQLKGAAKYNRGRKNSKISKLATDADTNLALGPIPHNNLLFAGLHFLLTCTENPKSKAKKINRSEDQDKKQQYSSEEDSSTVSNICTDTEDLEFSQRPFNKERLKEQLQAGGGIVYRYFDDVPKSKYSECKLIVPRPCLSAKYIQCLAAGIRSVTHDWVIMSCTKNILLDEDAFLLPAGWSILKKSFVNWVPSILCEEREIKIFNNITILLCGEPNTFVKFWRRVCNLAGGKTRVVTKNQLNMLNAFVLVTDWDCPHEIQNKASEDNVPLVNTNWVIQCLIEDRIISPTYPVFSFLYVETE